MSEKGHPTKRVKYTCRWIDFDKGKFCGEPAVVRDDHQMRWVCALHATSEHERLRSARRQRQLETEN